MILLVLICAYSCPIFPPRGQNRHSDSHGLLVDDFSEFWLVAGRYPEPGLSHALAPEGFEMVLNIFANPTYHLNHRHLLFDGREVRGQLRYQQRSLGASRSTSSPKSPLLDRATHAQLIGHDPLHQRAMYDQRYGQVLAEDNYRYQFTAVTNSDCDL